MTEQALDLRKALQLVWRRKRLLAIVAAIGLLLGSVDTALSPPQPASAALVILPAGLKDMTSQAVIAGSDAVLQTAEQSVDSGMPLPTLRKKLAIKDLTSNVISISATGSSAAAAEDTANAVAQSYINLLGSANAPGGTVQARILQGAQTATVTPLFVQLLETEALGVIAGLLIGAIIALALGRGDKRLRERDQIADSIGVPVLVSLPVVRSSDAAGWARLLGEYQPAVVHAWRMRTTLRELGIGEGAPPGRSVTVLTLAADPRALALGPQLAVFAASLGIRTTLAIPPYRAGKAGAGTDANSGGDPAGKGKGKGKDSARDDTLTALRTAAAAGAARLPDGLTVTVAEPGADPAGAQGLNGAGHHGPGGDGAALTVVVAVVDDARPELAGIRQTTLTVLGASAGVVSAAQLARVAVAAADAGRQLAGVLVADPLSSDRTTGRLPQLARPAQRKQPNRLTGTTTGAGARR
jgi:capsular polysaccharide biosynthesis protein